MMMSGNQYSSRIKGMPMLNNGQGGGVVESLKHDTKRYVCYSPA
jgi:hypothetical protein